MAWPQAIDTALFRFVNQSLANPAFDWLMPKLAGHALFLPAVIVAGALLLWKGGRRGRLFVLLLALTIGLTDGLVCNTIKKAVARPRPGIALPDTRALLGSTTSGSMPSSHAANCFAATVVAFIFYRRSWRFMVPAAAAVSFSRVYDGVHYPSDVIAGAILGAGCAAAAVWSADALWRCLGRKWFPLWWQNLPSLMLPEAQTMAGAGTARGASLNREALLGQHWLRLGYILIGASLLFRLCYIASGTIELSKDEAYQWLWSKHLALSYYSKPPGIAFIQFAGTSLWGDTQLGVRFFSPVFAAILSLVMLRFLAREASARLGFLLLLIVTTAPLMGIGTILMTIDPPLVLCCTLAMVAGWRAVQPDGTTKQWALAGVAAGLGFLSKYSALYLIVCWAFLLPALETGTCATPATRSLCRLVDLRAQHAAGDPVELPARLDHRPARRRQRRAKVAMETDTEVLPGIPARRSSAAEPGVLRRSTLGHGWRSGNAARKTRCGSISFAWAHRYSWGTWPIRSIRASSLTGSRPP